MQHQGWLSVGDVKRDALMLYIYDRLNVLILFHFEPLMDTP